MRVAWWVCTGKGEISFATLYEIAVVIGLWGMAMGTNALRVLVIDPYLSVTDVHPAARELIYLSLVTLFLLAIPLYVSRKMDGYSLADLSLTWRSRSTNVVIFALVFGTVSGAAAFWSGKTVVGVQAPSAGALLFAATHVLLDFQALGAVGAGGWKGVLFALVMQTLGGCLLGLIFIKTRTLWPGVVCHYLVNWLPSILSLIRVP